MVSAHYRPRILIHMIHLRQLMSEIAEKAHQRANSIEMFTSTLRSFLVFVYIYDQCSNTAVWSPCAKKMIIVQTLLKRCSVDLLKLNSKRLTFKFPWSDLELCPLNLDQIYHNIMFGMVAINFYDIFGLINVSNTRGHVL